jgi:spoIIIJ-associated protein
MSPEKTTLEIIAPTIEEAIETGLGQLGIPRDAVDVEVLDAGSKGLFGLGSRQSRVRLTIKSPDDEMGKPAAAKPAVKRAPKPASKPADEPEAASLPSARVSAPASNKTEGISSDDEF